MEPRLENEAIIEENCYSSSHGRKSHHSEKAKKNLISRLNRIEGQVRGIKGLRYLL